MGYAENLACAVVTDDMAPRQEKIRDVELVASLSGCTSLGSDMMRAKDYDVYALRRAIGLLARKVRRTLNLGMGPAQTLSAAAILEVMHWQCRQCSGASEQILQGVRQVCPTCGGSGIHRWSDKDRSRATGYHIATWTQWAGRYERILSMARMADSWTVVDARRRLG